MVSELLETEHIKNNASTWVPNLSFARPARRLDMRRRNCAQRGSKSEALIPRAGATVGELGKAGASRSQGIRLSPLRTERGG